LTGWKCETLTYETGMHKITTQKGIILISTQHDGRVDFKAFHDVPVTLAGLERVYDKGSEQTDNSCLFVETFPLRHVSNATAAVRHDATCRVQQVGASHITARAHRDCAVVYELVFFFVDHRSGSAAGATAAAAAAAARRCLVASG
jgi:hypothetical protein